MAGRGPAPKPADKRARRNLDSRPTQVIEIVPMSTVPTLPASFMVASRDGAEAVEFPPETLTWWRDWVESPFARDYDALVWGHLRLAAQLHARAILGDLKAASEYRLWMNDFPETPANRLRQRIEVARAVDAEVTATRKVAAARNSFAGLRAVDALEA